MSADNEAVELTRPHARSTIAAAFARCRAEHRAAFIPFLIAGDPDPETSVRALAACADGGADLIEIGIPYSDPIADGPTIQHAAQRALVKGMTFDGALELASAAKRSLPDTPLIGFTYFNPIFVRGIDKTAHDFAQAGYTGIVVPDLPPMEAQPLLDAFGEHGLAVSLLVAPTTSRERAADIATRCTGFVYLVSRMGVTGAHAGAGELVRTQVARLREVTSKPLAVGFGVASEDQVADLAGFADGVIVGSALIARMAAARTSEDAVEVVRTYCSRAAAACRRSPVKTSTP